MLADGYLGGLIVFVAAILAVPECLSGYRIHGKNAYQSDQSQAIEVRKKRLPLYQIEFGAMRRWLEDNGYTREQLPVRVFLDCWNIYLEGEGFLLKPPSRLRFFWWTVRKNHADSRVQGWKFTALKYATSLSALILGYRHADVLDKWQAKTIRAYQMIFGRRANETSNSC